MKNIFLIITIFIFSACSDSFLQIENKNSLDVTSFFKTERDLSLAVNSAYNPINYYGLFGLEYFMKMNTLDPYLWQADKYPAGLDKLTIGTSDFQNTWDHLYIGLFRTSDILANINKLSTVIDSKDFNNYKGQVTALRGLYYFYLVTWFNKPVYYDETNIPTDPSKPLTNGDPEMFWNKLEEDLTFASQNLPDVWDSPSTNLGRITKGAANALLGKALLYKHYHYYLRFGKPKAEADANLLKAKNAFQRVIDGGFHKLIEPKAPFSKADYQGALLCNSSYIDIPAGTNSYPSENNSESVWELQYNETGYNPSLPGWQSGGNQLYEYFGPSTSSYRNIVILPSLWFKFETAGAPAGYDRDPRAYATCFVDGNNDNLDWREVPLEIFSGSLHTKWSSVASLYTQPKILGNTGLGIKKGYYPRVKTLGISPNNVRLIKYSDVLLMYAETCFQYDTDADGAGLAALNQVRSRAGMPAKPSLTTDVIMNERLYEFATEGHVFNDLVRWGYDSKFGIDFGTIFEGNFSYPKNCYFPIPQPEINTNKGFLNQNPGW